MTMNMKSEPLYEIDRSIFPPACLPTGIDKSNLVDVTRIGDQWRKYLDTSTDKLHDCAKYFAESQKPEQP